MSTLTRQVSPPTSQTLRVSRRPSLRRGRNLSHFSYVDTEQGSIFGIDLVDLPPYLFRNVYHHLDDMSEFPFQEALPIRAHVTMWLATLRSRFGLGCSCVQHRPYCETMQNAPVLLLSRLLPVIDGGSLSIKKDLGHVICLTAIIRYPLTCTAALSNPVPLLPSHRNPLAPRVQEAIPDFADPPFLLRVMTVITTFLLSRKGPVTTPGRISMLTTITFLKGHVGRRSRACG